jgi:hypothetical protein
VELKNLILIVGGLLIAAVVAHGLWIAWRARRDPLRLKIDDKLISAVAERDPVQADFPNGGARVVSRWGEPADQSDLDLEVRPRGAAGTAGAFDRWRDGAGGCPHRAGQDRAVAGPLRRGRRRGIGAGRRHENRLAQADGGRVDAGWAGDPAGGETLAEMAVREAAAEQAGLREPRAVDAGARGCRGCRGGTPWRRAGAPDLRAEIRVGEPATDKPEGLRAGVARRMQEALNKPRGTRPAARQPSGNGRASASASVASHLARASPSGAAGEGLPEDLILINVLAPREQPFTGTRAGRRLACQRVALR